MRRRKREIEEEEEEHNCGDRILCEKSLPVSGPAISMGRAGSHSQSVPPSSLSLPAHALK